jgi:hypothetical protein
MHRNAMQVQHFSKIRHKLYLCLDQISPVDSSDIAKAKKRPDFNLNFLIYTKNTKLPKYFG